MNQYFTWTLQILILATGIYFFLRFLRTTRGGLLRGLVVAVLFGVVGLWGLAKVLELEELDHIIQSVTGFLAVILAILFQPELRRGIAQLGDHPMMGRFLAKRRKETVNEVIQAVNAMASRHQGALIAFEREFALDAYIDNAVKIDSDVNRLLIESIFQPGGALHDGAIVVRKDRVAAATCLFPLTENIEISKSTGTRHRAALGLTEETDALTLAVSEETGSISICKRGKMTKDIPSHRLEEVLRESLGREENGESDKEEEKEGSRKLQRAVVEIFARDVLRKMAAITLAAGLLFVANRTITENDMLSLRVVSEREQLDDIDQPGLLALRLPGEDYHLVSPEPGTLVNVTISGTRAQIETAKPRLSGLLVVTDVDPDGPVDLPLGDVDWNTGDWGGGPGLKFEWTSDIPRLVIERVGRTRITLEATHVSIDARGMDGRFEPRTESLTFDPTSVLVTGPQGAIAALKAGELLFGLEPLVVDASGTTDRREPLHLSQELTDQGLALADGTPVMVSLEIVPVERTIGTVEREITLVCLEQDKRETLDRWKISALDQPARVRIITRGILPDVDVDSTVSTEAGRVRDYVRDHLRVWVDTAQVDENGGRGVRVQIVWTGTDGEDHWRSVLDIQDPRAELRVELESSAEILLERR